MILLRNLQANDLKEYEYWNQPFHTYHSLNGPYFKKKTMEEVAEMVKTIELKIKQDEPNPLPQRKIISNINDDLIGEVSWSWRSQETLWMEIGIVIFNPNFWKKGIGHQALELWIDELFNTHKNIVRLGLTTWSGNIGMIKLAERLQMIKEAKFRKARIVDGKYYDSISYGILREEWQNKRVK